MRKVEQAEREAESAKLIAAEQAARAAREEEKVVERKMAEQAARETFNIPMKEESVKRVDKNDFSTARMARPTMTSSVTTTVDLPTVNPIPDKSYEPMREPTIVAKPVSQTVPGLKITGSTTTSSFSTTTATSRPTNFTTTRPASTSFNSRPSTAATNTFNRAISNTATKTSASTTNARSTEDIMAAIERLRASMKK